MASWGFRTLHFQSRETSPLPCSRSFVLHRPQLLAQPHASLALLRAALDWVPGSHRFRRGARCGRRRLPLAAAGLGLGGVALAAAAAATTVLVVAAAAALRLRRLDRLCRGSLQSEVDQLFLP